MEPNNLYVTIHPFTRERQYLYCTATAKRKNEDDPNKFSNFLPVTVDFEKKSIELDEGEPRHGMSGLPIFSIDGTPVAVYGYFKKQIMLKLPGKKKTCWVSLSKPVVDGSSRDAFFLEAMKDYVTTTLDGSKYAFELVALTGTGKTTISTVILAEMLCKRARLIGEPPQCLTIIQPPRLAAMMTFETLKKEERQKYFYSIA